MLIQWLQPDFSFANEKGTLKQLVHEGWRQVNVITSPPGSVRGGHYHKYNREGFYVVRGSFTLHLWRSEEREEYEIGEGAMFLILPNVFHTFDYHEETILIGLYDRGVELSETEKDIWTE